MCTAREKHKPYCEAVLQQSLLIGSLCTKYHSSPPTVSSSRGFLNGLHIAAYEEIACITISHGT